MNKTVKLMLAAACLAAGMAQGATTAPAGAVVGWWKFDNPNSPGLDSGEYGNDLDGLSKVSFLTADSGYVDRGCYDGSGCMQISTKGNTATATANCLWSTSSPCTYIMKIRSGISITKMGDTQMMNLIGMISDFDKWHCISYRHDPDKLTGKSGSTHKYWLFGDSPNAASDLRGEVDDDDAMYYPVTISSGTKIAIGGKVGASLLSDSYKGLIDDVVVVSRTMTKNEIDFYYKTGEPWIRLDSDSTTGFTESSGWSCNEYNLHDSPTTLPGGDFIVDNGKKLTVSVEGQAFPAHSLTLGRTEPLKSVIDGSTIATANGYFIQQASVTVGDLRLNGGKITASAGKTLTATKLAVDATAENPFEVAVGSDAYTVTGSASGDGWLKKTGAGTLDLRGLTGAAKVVVTEGKVLAGANITVVYAEDEGAVPVLMVE